MGKRRTLEILDYRPLDTYGKRVIQVHRERGKINVYAVILERGEVKRLYTFKRSAVALAFARSYKLKHDEVLPSLLKTVMFDEDSFTL